jgi:hypothetical protein
VYHVPGSPFNLTILPAATSGRYSTMASATDAMRNATATIANIMRLTARDIGDNLIRKGLAKVNGTGTLISPSTPTSDPAVLATKFYVSVTDLHDGDYDIRYTANVAGTYSFTIMINDEHVHGSPFELVVLPNVMVVSSTVVTGSGLSLGVTGVTYSIYVQGRDAWKNNLLDFQIGSRTSLFNVSLECAAGTSDFTIVLPDSVSYQGAATFLFKYVPIKAAKNCFVVVSGYSVDQPVPGFPWPVVIRPGPPLPTNCLLDGPGLVGQTAGLPVSFTLTAYVNLCFLNNCFHFM